MTTITVTTKSTELEPIVITLTQDQVQSIYDEVKELRTKVAELEKSLSNEKQYKETYSNQSAKLQKEIDSMHTIFTVMGVKEKTDAEESWNRRDLDLVTRMALFIAQNK